MVYFYAFVSFCISEVFIITFVNRKLFILTFLTCGCYDTYIHALCTIKESDAKVHDNI